MDETAVIQEDDELTDEKKLKNRRKLALNFRKKLAKGFTILLRDKDKVESMNKGTSGLSKSTEQE